MSSKTFVPAFQAKVGDWSYYLCLMSYAQVAREINFAYELGVNKDLGTMIQRGIGVRTGEITKYLLENEHRFLGALVVAAWGGDPDYVPLRMADTEENGVLDGVDRQFGVLTFDGTHQFFALDGQHRLRAIKDALKQDLSLGSEDISVIVVPHFDDVDGRRRTRRLFTNINRNAVKTTTQEDIALDEDDGFAILTRRLLDEDAFVGKSGTVQVFGKSNGEGGLTLATRQVTASQPAWTTIGILYGLIKDLGWDLHHSMTVPKSPRAEDEVLDASYEVIGTRLRELLGASGDLLTRYDTAVGKQLRAPKGHEGDGHPFMRPVVQLAIGRAVRHVVERKLLTWDEALDRLRALDWRMETAPFNAVWQSTPDGKTNGKMITGKDNQDLLLALLLAHVAPISKAQVTRAINSYKALKGTRYPVAADTLMTGAVAAPVEASDADIRTKLEEMPEVEDTSTEA